MGGHVRSPTAAAVACVYLLSRPMRVNWGGDRQKYICNVVYLTSCIRVNQDTQQRRRDDLTLSPAVIELMSTIQTMYT